MRGAQVWEGLLVWGSAFWGWAILGVGSWLGGLDCVGLGGCVHCRIDSISRCAVAVLGVWESRALKVMVGNDLYIGEV